MEQFAENPRAVIGDNGAPPDYGPDAPDFISARIIERGAEYLRWNFGELDALLQKRKGARPMGYRHILAWALADIVPQQSFARYLGINRKTWGEGAARPDRWGEEDEAFQEQLERLRQALVGHATQDVVFINERVEYFVVEDVSLRALEQRRKEHLQAAQAAERAAAELDARAKVKRLAPMAKTLHNHPDRDAIIAKHVGPKAIAKQAGKEALAVLEALYTREQKLCDDTKRKVTRLVESEVDPFGLKECLRLGLAAYAEPHLSKATDKMIRPETFGLSVYLEAIASGDIVKPKRKTA